MALNCKLEIRRFCVGVRPCSEQFVTSGLSRSVVRAGPEHRKVVHPRGFQQSPWSTSLESVPHGAVVGADLHVGVTGDSRGLALLTLANGTQIRLIRPVPTNTWTNPGPARAWPGSRRDRDPLLHCSDGSAR
jgi:hypothetical protein